MTIDPQEFDRDLAIAKARWNLTHGAKPANDFWHGYERDPQMTAKLVGALAEALAANPTMRLGQLIWHLVDHVPYWNIYDEQFLYVLTLAATGEAGWAKLKELRDDIPRRRPEKWVPWTP